MKKTFLIVLIFIALVFLGKKRIETTYFNKTFQKTTLEKFQTEVVEKDIKLITIGENHRYFLSYDISLDFLKLLYETRNIRHFLLEFPPANAQYANKFVLTGNEEYLYKAINFPGVINNKFKIQHVKFENFFRDLYEFNRSKTFEDKVKLVGVDLEFRPHPFFNFLLTEVVKDRNLKWEIEDLLVKYPDTHTKTYTKDHKTFLKKLQSKLDKDLDPMTRYFIKSAIDTSNIHQTKAVDLNKREVHISKNIEYISKLYPNETFILVIGKDHIFKSKVNSYTSCVYLLKTQSDYFKDKTLSLDIERRSNIKSNSFLSNNYIKDKIFYKTINSDMFNNIANFIFPKKKISSNKTFEYGQKYSDIYDYLIIK